MHTVESLMKDLQKAGIHPEGTLLVHSSMKAIGEVEGSAETVLDAFIATLANGLLLFPTHSWSEKNLVDGLYDPKTESACVGILPNLFMKRPGAIRSMHPTHSVTAIGSRAAAYAHRDDDVHTPCPRQGCFGGLVDEDAQILFLGASLKTNTFIHGIEEWMNIPDRISPTAKKIKIRRSDGSLDEIDYCGHFSSIGDVSKNYDKLLKPLLERGIAREVFIGDAKSYMVMVKPMTELVMAMLKKNPSLFSDDLPIPDKSLLY